MTTADDFNVTSTVFKATQNGFHQFFKSELLIPHEALRRETTRALTALRAFDIKQHPWKAHQFHKWFMKFYVPSVLLQSHLAEDVCVPFYLKLLGDEPAPQPKHNYKVIMKSLDDIAKKLQQIVDLLSLDASSAQASALALELTEQFEQWAATFTDHLADIETIWPPHTEKFGEVPLVVKLLLPCL